MDSSVCYQTVFSVKSQKLVQSNGQEPFAMQSSTQTAKSWSNLSTLCLVMAMSSKQITPLADDLLYE